ncbi:unnamed protein product [Bursaphelenchus xylophilus]|uniref:phytanoyl-CoA dioxygenase n=1 Tax=Bursaphelenchus xylophilus TaxID=6326 RepID=A0A1I7S465_BURXY|nr:unnamed protein product [Bursaphelenchus xylophilus]CAG9116765.1 unnamed protein product [Bursaphelenchus xylophilus]
MSLQTAQSTGETRRCNMESPYTEQAQNAFYPKGKVLTPEQKQFYADNGFLIIKNCLSRSELDKYRRHFQNVCQDPKILPIETLLMNDVCTAKKTRERNENTILRLQDFNNDPVFFQYCQHPVILDIVQDLIGKGEKSNLMAMHTMLINKPPDVEKTLSSRHAPHQDEYFFPFGPSDYITCAWTAIDRCTKENGTLFVYPGTHKLHNQPHGYPNWENGVNKVFQQILTVDLDKLPSIDVEVEPGDTVFFHPNLIHGAGPNLSDGFRKTISCHYANADECRYIDVSGTYRTAVADEVVEMFNGRYKKIGIPLARDWAHLWRMRARPVNARRAHL